MTNSLKTNAPLISKEELLRIKFPQDDVFTCDEAKKVRAVKIHNATRLGNLEYKKVGILFNDGQQIKKVFTTVWAQTKNTIFLKEKIVIPVGRIVDIEF